MPQVMVLKGQEGIRYADMERFPNPQLRIGGMDYSLGAMAAYGLVEQDVHFVIVNVACPAHRCSL